MCLQWLPALDGFASLEQGVDLGYIELYGKDPGNYGVRSWNSWILGMEAENWEAGLAVRLCFTAGRISDWPLAEAESKLTINRTDIRLLYRHYFLDKRLTIETEAGYPGTFAVGSSWQTDWFGLMAGVSHDRDVSRVSIDYADGYLFDLGIETGYYGFEFRVNSRLFRLGYHQLFYTDVSFDNESWRSELDFSSQKISVSFLKNPGFTMSYGRSRIQGNIYYNDSSYIKIGKSLIHDFLLESELTIKDIWTFRASLISIWTDFDKGISINFRPFHSSAGLLPSLIRRPEWEDGLLWFSLGLSRQLGLSTLGLDLFVNHHIGTLGYQEREYSFFPFFRYVDKSLEHDFVNFLLKATWEGQIGKNSFFSITQWIPLDFKHLAREEEGPAIAGEKPDFIYGGLQLTFSIYLQSRRDPGD